MEQDGSISLFHYWDRLRAGRPAPLRADIEPADIRKLLADTFILEQDARGEAVFRLAGTRLCATYGRELKGFSFNSLWKEKDRRLVGRLSQGVFARKNVVVLTFEGVTRDSRTNLFELLLLPLDGGKDNPRCLGIVSAMRKPYWLGADPIIDANIESARVMDPDQEAKSLQRRPQVSSPPLAPTSRALSDANDHKDGRRIRHLVVLDGGRAK